jgi:protein SCO1/2
MIVQSKTRFRIVGTILVIAALALLFGLWSQHNLAPKKTIVTLARATVFPQPRSIPAFNLIDKNNQPFTNANLQGHWSLLFFGFTNCPELCPTTLATLDQTYKELQEAKQSPMPQVILISVDPESDSPNKIKQYLQSFNAAFLGATGEQKQIDQLTQAMGILAMKVMSTNKEQATYSIDHSGTILIIDPKGDLYGIFTTPHDATLLAHDMQAIIAGINASH